MYIHKENKLSYSDLQGSRALIQIIGCPKNKFLLRGVHFYPYAKRDRLTKD